MATLLEMAVEIVAAHASSTSLSKEELIAELADVHKALSALEKGEAVAPETAEEAAAPTISRKKAFGKDKVVCMICGKEMKIV